MAIKVLILRNQYRDSVFLMRINDEVERQEGVNRAAVMMGTDANKDLMKEAGLYVKEVDAAGPNDLVIVVDAENDELGEKALSVAKSMVFKAGEGEKAEEVKHKSVRSAVYDSPDIALVLISTPGEYAYLEAKRSLVLNRHVMVFSSNVPVEKELDLKRYAEKKGLFVMGPDAGTSIINGVGLGFFNVVRDGPVGITGAAGTGIQELSSMLHNLGTGITSAIGTGSNDPKDSIGGITTKMAIRAFGKDERTKVISLVSKPPGKNTMPAILEELEMQGKPSVVLFLGYEGNRSSGKIEFAEDIEDEAIRAYRLATGKHAERYDVTKDQRLRLAIDGLSGDQQYIRGLFSGGTVCYESQLIAKRHGRRVYSNAPLDNELYIGGFDESKKDTFIDMGDEEFVRGVPHPMIDFRFRRERIIKEAKDKEVAVILLDVVLGYGANADPAGELIPAIEKAKEVNSRLVFVASIIGTDMDPQGIAQQEGKLESHGVIVYPSSAAAARAALFVAGRGSL